MFIMVKEKFELMEEMDNSSAVIQIAKDRKNFTVIKHTKFPESEGNYYNISQLNYILLAGN